MILTEEKTKEKLYKLNVIKMTNICASKNTIKVKDNSQYQRNILNQIYKKLYAEYKK